MSCIRNIGARLSFGRCCIFWHLLWSVNCILLNGWSDQKVVNTEWNTFLLGKRQQGGITREDMQLAAKATYNSLLNAYDTCLLVPSGIILWLWGRGGGKNVPGNTQGARSKHKTEVGSASPGKPQGWVFPANKNSRYPNGSIPCALLGMGDRDGSLKAVHYLLCAAKDLMVPKEYNQLHEEMQKFVNEVGFLPKTLILLQFCSPGSWKGWPFNGVLCFFGPKCTRFSLSKVEQSPMAVLDQLLQDILRLNDMPNGQVGQCNGWLC